MLLTRRRELLEEKRISFIVWRYKLSSSISPKYERNSCIKRNEFLICGRPHEWTLDSIMLMHDKFNKLHCLTERDSRLTRYFALLWGLELRLGYLATSGAKSDVIFLLGDHDFPQGRWNFVNISHRFQDPHFGVFEGLELLLGYLASSGTKSDVTFLARQPRFPIRATEFREYLASFSRSQF